MIYFLLCLAKVLVLGIYLVRIVIGMSETGTCMKPGVLSPIRADPCLVYKDSQPVVKSSFAGGVDAADKKSVPC